MFKKLLRAVGYRLKSFYFLIRTLFVTLCTEKAWLLDFIPASSKGKNSIMLVRLDVIGDFILWLDSAKAYRNIYPDKSIVLYANSSWAELAKQLNYWDEVISVDMPKLRANEIYRLKTFFNIRRKGFLRSIQQTYSREYMSDMLMRSSGAKIRIGYEGDLSNIQQEQKLISDHWYTQLIKAQKLSMMELKRNAEFVRALGFKSFISSVPEIPLNFNLQEKHKFNSPYIVVFPGASWVPKMWPADKFSLLIKKLKAEHNVKVVLCGSQSEYALCQKIIDESGEDAENLSGATTLQELIEIIRKASLVVANDTSAIHIAAATQTNSICVLGGGHYGRFLPYQIEASDKLKLPQVQIHKMDCYDCNWNCRYIRSSNETVPCVANISVEQVYIACNKILKFSADLVL